VYDSRKGSESFGIMDPNGITAIVVHFNYTILLLGVRFGWQSILHSSNRISELGDLKSGETV